MFEMVVFTLACIVMGTIRYYFAYKSDQKASRPRNIIDLDGSTHVHVSVVEPNPRALGEQNKRGSLSVWSDSSAGHLSKVRSEAGKLSTEE